MSDFQAIADRFEIEALRGEFTYTLMLRDYDRFASLFTEHGAWRIPTSTSSSSAGEIRAGIERMQGLWDYFVQTTHPGAVQLEGDTAFRRAYISEFGHIRDGRSELNYSVYHDRYQRTSHGWKFVERIYEVRYLDTTPLAGSTPREGADREQVFGENKPLTIASTETNQSVAYSTSKRPCDRRRGRCDRLRPD